ncbi:hypothetical protein J8J27_25135, partial [Mycobacterium tuberculosis]|nr:hypothetical protein [Mycobacterium tuberculosis]
FEDYLIDQGLEESRLILAGGEERAGLDLRTLVTEARTVKTLLDGLNPRYNRDIVEQAAIAGGLSAALLNDRALAERVVASVVARLDQLADTFERGWHGEARPDG